MRKIANLVAAALPFAYLAIYLVIAVQDRAKLDSDLKYRMPPGVEVEDVIGFGFWPTWTLLTIPFAALCLVSYGLGRQRRPEYWTILALAFLGLTLVGAYYGSILESQVLERP